MTYTYGRYNDGYTITEESMVLKRCGTCGDHKPLEAFSKDGRRQDGLRNKCKPCDNYARRERGYVQKEECVRG